MHPGFLLNPDVAYLNHGGYGALPGARLRRVPAIPARAGARAGRLLHTAGVTGPRGAPRSRPGRLTEARSMLASFLGARRSDVRDNERRARMFGKHPSVV